MFSSGSKIYNMFSSGGSWTPHKVELAVWTHYVARDNKPEILADMPSRQAHFYIIYHYCIILYHVFLSFMPQYVVYFIIYYYHICPNKL